MLLCCFNYVVLGSNQIMVGFVVLKNCFPHMDWYEIIPSGVLLSGKLKKNISERLNAFKRGKHMIMKLRLF